MVAVSHYDSEGIDYPAPETLLGLACSSNKEERNDEAFLGSFSRLFGITFHCW